MDDASLYLCSRKYASIAFVNSASSSTHNQDIIHTAVFKAVKYTEPKLYALVLSDPHTKHIAHAVHLHTDGGYTAFLIIWP